MKVINVREAKTHLSRLIDAAAEGEEIILGKHGKPLVRLISFAQSKEPRCLGGREGESRVAPDFDEEDERIHALFR